MILKKIIVTVAALACSAVFAQSGNIAPNVNVSNAWARASVTGQTATGAFMTLTAKNGVHGIRLMGGSSPVAGITEVHEMKMDGDIMRMRALPDGLALPADQAVYLKPGSYHIMLMDLKAPLAKGSTVPLTLIFKDAKGAQSQQELKLPVAISAAHGVPSFSAPAMQHNPT